MEQVCTMRCIMALVMCSNPRQIRMHESHDGKCMTYIFHFRSSCNYNGIDVFGEGYAVLQEDGNFFHDKIAIYDDFDKSLLYFNKIISKLNGGKCLST